MGTRPKNFDFSAADVCSILDGCAKTGVTKLTLGSLLVEFGPPDPAPAESSPAPATSLDGSRPDHQKINEATLRIEERLIREEQLAMLAIEDPLAFEQQLRDGGLDEHAPDEEDAG